jgi:hypothetical protein
MSLNKILRFKVKLTIFIIFKPLQLIAIPFPRVNVHFINLYCVIALQLIAISLYITITTVVSLSHIVLRGNTDI